MEKAESKSVKKSGRPQAATSSLPVAYKLELHRMIELSAYYRAEKDGFRCSPQEYWLEAESELQRYP